MLKVAMIAPGPEKDGVKKYADFLVDELKDRVELDRMELFRTVSLLKALILSYRVSGYDVVQVQFTPEWWGNIFGYFWGSHLIPFLLLARARTVVTAHEYDFDHPNPFVHRIQELKFRLIYSLADRVIVHNERGREYVQGIAPRADVSVIPHGLPEVEEAGEELNIDGEVILVFGFIRRDKDYEAVLDALKDLPDRYHLLIAGSARTEEDERYEQEMEQKVGDMGLEDRVTFYGYVPDDEIGKVFSTADVSVMPYDSSSGSGVLALSLAYEVPVVMSDIPLARETGLKTYSRKEELTDILEGGFPEPGYLEHIENLREDRSWKTVAGKTVNLYQETVQ